MPPGEIAYAYADEQTLTRHLDRSNSKVISAQVAEANWWRDYNAESQAAYAQAHDEVKHSLGCYDPDFEGGVEHKEKKREEEDLRKGRKFSQKLNIKFSDDVALSQGIAPGHGLIRGGPEPRQLYDFHGREQAFNSGGTAFAPSSRMNRRHWQRLRVSPL